MITEPELSGGSGEFEPEPRPGQAPGGGWSAPERAEVGGGAAPDGWAAGGQGSWAAPAPDPWADSGPGDGDLLLGGADPAPGTSVRRQRWEHVLGGAGRSHWAWALGGIAVASALWTASLYATGVWRDDGHVPDLHGYELRDSPCTDSGLAPLSEALGALVSAGTAPEFVLGTTLDRAACGMSGGNEPAGEYSWSVGYMVSVSVELHKKTDPRPEFEDMGLEHNTTFRPNPNKPVAGLGDVAYFKVDEGNNDAQTLRVLHGGAVLTLYVNVYVQWASGEGPRPSVETPPETDIIALRPAMIDAARSLLTELKH